MYAQHNRGRGGHDYYCNKDRGSGKNNEGGRQMN